MTAELQQALVTGLSLGFVYALIALGFGITFGVMKIANFAHGEFVAAGMYLMIVFNDWFGLPPILAIPLAALGVAIIGMIFEWLTIEPIAGQSHFMQMIVTLGGLIILQQIASIIFGSAPIGVDHDFSFFELKLGEAFISGARVVASLAALVAIAIVMLGLHRTFFGRAVRAVAENRLSARLMGVNTLTINLVAFGLGAGCAGLAGALIVPFLYVSPDIGLGLSVKSFIVIMIAGPSSMLKILAVSIFLGMVEAISGVYLSLSLTPAIVYVSLMGVLVLMMIQRHLSGNLVSLGEKEVT